MITGISLESGRPCSASFWGALCDLFKARLASLVLLTVAVGYHLGAERFDVLRLINTLFGTGLLIFGAASLNQFLERQNDSQMSRTQQRPLACGRFGAETVLIAGGCCVSGGMVWLALSVGLLPAILGVIGALNYIFLYTLLKRATALNIVPGAISGAVPPLIGWAAAKGELSPEAWSIAAILFFWQLPHFLAIAWMHRGDYTHARFFAVSFEDPGGLLFSRYALSNALCLLLVSTTPFFLGLSGPVYLCCSMLLGVALLGFAVRFCRSRNTENARLLFRATIVYLPLLLGALAICKKANL